MSSADTEHPPSPPSLEDPSRRRFVAGASTLMMGCGLCAGYGTLGALAARYLYPAHPQLRDWMFVTDVGSLMPGESMVYRSPSGEPINIARQGQEESVGSFIALSSVCPHLGCQVLWEGQNHRFFCPCHNGVFDPQGNGIAGPPAGQLLLRYPLKIENGLLFVEVPLESLDSGKEGPARG